MLEMLIANNVTYWKYGSAMKSWEIVLKIPVINHGTCYRFTGHEC